MDKLISKVVDDFVGKLLEDTGGSDDDEAYIGGCGAGKVFNSECFFSGEENVKTDVLFGEKRKLEQMF